MDKVRRQEGFSLLEVMVAFTVLALTLGVLLQIFGNGVRLAGSLDEYTRATLLAESKLAQIDSEEPLEEGESHGDFVDEPFHWQVTVSPFEPEVEELDSETLPARLYRIEVRVEWAEGEKDRSVELTTLRLAAKTIDDL